MQAQTSSKLASVPIGENNVGNRLLQKMGWSEGQGLGRKNQGRTNIIEVIFLIIINRILYIVCMKFVRFVFRRKVERPQLVWELNLQTLHLAMTTRHILKE